jgi:thiol-disulfide isomerase/thioredoxin
MTMNRRHWMLAGAGTAAAAAGLAWQLRRSGGSVGPLADDPAIAAFWQAKFTQPDGQLLVLASLRGAPLLVNFWATWCPPCVKEMPEIDRFAREFGKSRRGRVLGLAVDNPSAVKSYLARRPVSYAIGLAGFDGTDLSRALGNSSGALPFTALFDGRGALVQRRLGETSFDELTRWSGAL